jgi:hypothetical protein
MRYQLPGRARTVWRRSSGQLKMEMQSTGRYDATIPVLMTKSPTNKTIETPAYNIASIMVFPFHFPGETM